LRQQEVKIEMLRKKLDRKIEENNTLSKKLKDNMIIYDNVNGNSKKSMKRSNSKIVNSSSENQENTNTNTNTNNKQKNEKSNDENNNKKENKNKNKNKNEK